MFALHRCEHIFSVFGIYHIWSAQIRNIHDLIFEVWDIPILICTCWGYPWFTQTWSAVIRDIHGLSLLLADKYGINMGYICTRCFFHCHVTLQPCCACSSQQHAYGSPSEAQLHCPLCLPLKVPGAPKVEACQGCPSQTARATGSLCTCCFPSDQWPLRRWTNL